MTLNAGILAGIFGFDLLEGVILHFMIFALTSVIFYVKCKQKITDYFKFSYPVVCGGVFSDIMVK